MRWTLLVFSLVFAVGTGFCQEPRPNVAYPTTVHRSQIANDIEGIVYDQAGELVTGAEILVRSGQKGLEFRTTSAEDGSYKIGGLTTADTYELLVSRPKFEDFNVKGINISWRVATRVDVVLKSK